MKDSYNSMRSGIAKAKNLGSSKHGSSEWIAQRISAIAIIPLTLWLIYNICTYKFFNNDQPPSDFSWIVSLALFLMICLHHAYIGMVVVIEDYVKCLKLRYFFIITLKLLTYFTIIMAAFMTTQHISLV